MLDSPKTLRSAANTHNAALRSHAKRTATDLRLHDDIQAIARILLADPSLDPVNRLDLIASLNLLDRRV